MLSGIKVLNLIIRSPVPPIEALCQVAECPWVRWPLKACISAPVHRWVAAAPLTFQLGCCLFWFSLPGSFTCFIYSTTTELSR